MAHNDRSKISKFLKQLQSSKLASINQDEKPMKVIEMVCDELGLEDSRYNMILVDDSREKKKFFKSLQRLVQKNFEKDLDLKH